MMKATRRISKRMKTPMIVSDIESNPYSRAFGHNLSLRESCFNCPCKGGRSHADITLSDFWGIEKVIPQMDDDRGTSAVMIHSSKASALWKSVTDGVVAIECTKADIIRINTCYDKSVEKPAKRTYFVLNFKNQPFDKLVDYCLKTTWYQHIFKSICFRWNKYINIIERYFVI